MRSNENGLAMTVLSLLDSLIDYRPILSIILLLKTGTAVDSASTLPCVQTLFAGGSRAGHL